MKKMPAEENRDGEVAPVSKSARQVWCVKSREGWCAVKDGRRPPEAVACVPTKCEHYVILPVGIDRRVPTCRPCADIIEERP